MSKEIECTANETEVCCCVDVGTILDGEDCSAEVSAIVADEAAVETILAHWLSVAESKSSEPVTAKVERQAVEGGIQLTGTYTFGCQAEGLLFQLALR
ncbi:YfcZ/YiiS family protein [Corallincola platygyrae]|uniref:YfcZ/YiiS family protein n=1 Tax=Corallincola platygyrae TaxID=1193278 RepID=A0ABW4XSE3_9GAMM